MIDPFIGFRLMASFVLDDLNDQVKASGPFGPLLASLYVQPWLILFPVKR